MRVSLRAAEDASVLLSTAAGTKTLRPSPNDPSLFAAEVPARWVAGGGAFVVRRGADSVALPLTPGRLLAVDAPPLAEFLGVPASLPDTDRTTVVRPVPNGTYKWFLLPGTRLAVTGRQDTQLRVALGKDLEGWVDQGDARVVDSAAPAPRRVVGNGRVIAGAGWSELALPVGSPPAYAAEVEGNRLTITLYGTIGNTDIVNYASADSLIDRVFWEQVAEDRARYVIVLRDPVFGYHVRYERSALVVRVRATPKVSPLRPLAGLTIAVDAGHPPAGSTGPTGLYEPQATLPVAARVQRLLQERGATVVMTRKDPAALGLAERPAIARRANAVAFVSIHLNALPDGVNPFRAHGTGAYYFTGQSLPMARAIQAGMVRRMGLRDLGTNYDNLAVLRPTWMPAVLCEGAFLIIPQQEAALRTPEFQEAYALGVVEGLEEYFRQLSARSR